MTTGTDDMPGLQRLAARLRADPTDEELESILVECRGTLFRINWNETTPTELADAIALYIATRGSIH